MEAKVDPLLSLMNTADVAGLTSGEVQTEHGHQVNIKKLKIICDMILSGYENIEAVYLIPGTLFISRIEDVDELTFEIIMSNYNPDWAESGNEVISNFMKDEYPEFTGKVNVVTQIGRMSTDICSYILMSVNRHDSVYGHLTVDDMRILSTMISNGVPVAIPYTWRAWSRKCLMALVENVQDVYDLRSHMLGSLDMYGINVSSGSTDFYQGEWHYITAISNKAVPYGLPYEVLDRSILEQQIREAELKECQ